MRKRLIALIAVLAIVTTACGSDSGADDITQTTSSSATTAPLRIDKVAPRGEATQDEQFRESPTTTAAPSDTQFQDYGVNRPEDPQRDSLSTFAVDVDTGSYTLMRAWVNDGTLPDPDSVRVEEYVNYFDAGYEPPTEETFAIYADGGPTPFFARSSDILRIGIQGREISDRQRQDINLAFVIDVSGSMASQNKLDTVKSSMRVLVDELDRFDTVSIVAYNSDAWVVLSPTAGDEKDRIVDAIGSLRANGNTNAEDGLILGFDQADEAYLRDGVNRVVLLSDGVANVGNTTPEEILDNIGQRVRDDIDLVTIGVGIETYNDVLLEQLADQGNGWYAYIDTHDEAVKLFREELTTSLQTIARDAKIQVEFEPDLVEEYRLIGFENRALDDRDFRDDSVDAGELNAGHSVTALYEVVLTRDAYRSSQTFATVNVRWTDPETGRVDEIFGEINSGVLASRFSRTSSEFQVASTVAAYAEVLRDSRYVQADLDDVLDEAQALPGDAAGKNRVDEFVELVTRASRLRR